MKSGPLIVEHVYNASVKNVWDAITDLEKMKQWYFPTLCEFEPEIGFETRFDETHKDAVLSHIWKITDVVPLRKLTYKWKVEGYPGESILTWELFDEGETTKLILTHDKLETYRGDINKDFSRENFVNGWKYFTGRLAGYLKKEKD